MLLSAPRTKAVAPELNAQLATLQTLPLDALRIEWRRRYGTAAPTRLSRDLLTRGIAHRLQEAVHGGLRPATRRHLDAQLRSLAEGSTVAPSPSIRIKPGATLVRSWRGQTHTVQVLDAGFEYQGEHFASLSLIAQRITGAHWSGPRFFGLTLPPKPPIRGGERPDAPNP
jgi:hypothetical protein